MLPLIAEFLAHIAASDAFKFVEDYIAKHKANLEEWEAKGVITGDVANTVKSLIAQAEGILQSAIKNHFSVPAESAVIDTPAPAVVDTAAAVVDTPAPVVDTPAPAVVDTAAAVVDTPAPVVDTPAPAVVDTVAAVVDTPAPVVDTSAPVANVVVEPVASTVSSDGTAA